ncbi:MAG: sugar ABC transporter permease [Oscillospiraceae bacterium]|nr:sugar ABC transporter permease [Oscillospiraceae bacterium]
MSDKRAICLMVMPSLLIFVGIVFVPIVWTFVYSLYSGMPGFNFQFTGFTNYIEMFRNQHTMDSFRVNWRYIMIVTPLQVSFGLLIALMVHFSVRRNKTLVRTVVFIPTILPAVAVAQMFIKMLALIPNHGLVNALLDLAGLEQFIQPWLGQTSTAFTWLCVMDIWTAVGFHCVIIYGALVDVSEEIIEAARIDGAGRLRLFWNILLPCLKTILVTCLVFSFTGTIKMFESATALTRGGPGHATTSMTMNMYENAFTYNQYGYGSAVAFMILLQCIVVTFIVSKLGREKF